MTNSILIITILFLVSIIIIVVILRRFVIDKLTINLGIFTLEFKKKKKN